MKHKNSCTVQLVHLKRFTFCILNTTQGLLVLHILLNFIELYTQKVGSIVWLTDIFGLKHIFVITCLLALQVEALSFVKFHAVKASSEFHNCELQLVFYQIKIFECF